MFPPFITSFSDQVTAVFINLIGTVLGGAFNSIFSAFVTNVLVPIFEQIAPPTGA